MTNCSDAHTKTSNPLALYRSRDRIEKKGTHTAQVGEEELYTKVWLENTWAEEVPL